MINSNKLIRIAGSRSVGHFVHVRTVGLLSDSGMQYPFVLRATVENTVPSLQKGDIVLFRGSFQGGSDGAQYWEAHLVGKIGTVKYDTLHLLNPQMRVLHRKLQQTARKSKI